MNWQLIISDLKARQVSQLQIAAACNCKQSTISDLATGKTFSPSYELGKALIALHKRNRKALETELQGK